MDFYLILNFITNLEGFLIVPFIAPFTVPFIALFIALCIILLPAIFFIFLFY